MVGEVKLLGIGGGFIILNDFREFLAELLWMLSSLFCLDPIERFLYAKITDIHTNVATHPKFIIRQPLLLLCNFIFI